MFSFYAFSLCLTISVIWRTRCYPLLRRVVVEDVTLFVHLLVPFTTTYKHITSIFIIWFNNSYFLVQIIQYKGRKEMIINYNYLSLPRIYRELSPSSINWSCHFESFKVHCHTFHIITWQPSTKGAPPRICWAILWVWALQGTFTSTQECYFEFLWLLICNLWWLTESIMFSDWICYKSSKLV
jgi:hypothetical protein